MLSVRLPVDLRSVAAARELLERALTDDQTWPAHPAAAGDLQNAVLIVSELVTNAVRHTRSLLRLDIHITGRTLHVAVTDDAPELPILRNPDDDATHGRGIHIVHTLAASWGITHDGGSKTVWFEVTVPDDR